MFITEKEDEYEKTIYRRTNHPDLKEADVDLSVVRLIIPALDMINRAQNILACVTTSIVDDPSANFYALLEQYTAKQFNNEFLNIPMNCSRINWVASANYRIVLSQLFFHECS
jgi:hypothetical protein